MKRRTKILSTAGLLLVLVGAAIAAVVGFWPHGPPGVPPELVPASWEQFRTSAGHEVHLQSGKVACKDCHDYARDGFKSPGSAPCARCHEKEESHGHPGSAERPTECLACHAFAPGKERPACIGCHRDAQDHLAAVGVHATADCTACHRLHESPSIVPASCSECHGERAASHANHPGDKGCLDCHTGHAPATAAISTCAGCHANPAGPRPAGHDTCIGCHAPHDFAASPAGCVECHGAKATLGAPAVPAHSTCTTCHTPHAPAQATSSCNRCHADIRLVHGGKEACTACHEVHGSSVAPPETAACTSCHTQIATSDTHAHAPGLPCEGCHTPHDFTPPDRRTICAKCHAAETTLAAASKGHSDCSQCHGASVAHAPAAPPACGTCHEKEKVTAPSGHQTCTSCHQPHAATLLPQATCATCHADKAATPHGGVQGGCETCHRPHGPGGTASPPACATCHTRQQLPALHAVPAHGTCTTCHSSHEPPRSDRTTCTNGCHADRRDHQPQAQVCTGCHVFRR